MAGTATTPDAVAERLRRDVATLAALDRLPCSPGEREAAEWIAERLRDSGATVALDEELVHGGYFAPLGIAAAAAAIGGAAVRRGHRAGALLGAAAALLMEQDLAGGRRRWLRRRLPQRPTTNVVAELGRRDAPVTLVVHAHHDAARTSWLFDQTAPRLIATHFPGLLARMDRWPPLMGLVVAGPVLVALGARRTATAGAVVSAATAAVMADMARRPVVAGANDNLTGVAVLLEVARRLGGEPPENVRLVLLSAGAEESNQDGMLAFARRRFRDLPRACTTFLCLDTVGSPELLLIEGEGFLRMFPYADEVKELILGAADDAGVHIRRGLSFTFATDGLVPLREGYPVASIGSVNEYLVPSNYHWPTDTADNVDYGSVSDCVEVVLGVIARLANATASSADATSPA